MGYTRVKICGITRPKDAQLAAELGADAIGLNFVGGPRQIEIEQAIKIAQDLPPLVHVVALIGEGFTHKNLLKVAQSDLYEHIVCLQIYRSARSHPPSPGYYGMSRAFWPVLHVSCREFAKEVRLMVNELEAESSFPCAVLLDTATKKLGGSGKAFHWNWVAYAREASEWKGLPPIILAGGLTPDNVARAIRIVQPYAVDVSSGVEVARKPGVKDPIKMRDFIQAAKNA
ncbi:MAG: phosphoribosylanthranilate isomerase [Phycisphaerales bacterium]|nr:phosphoribosylanthranilate isomerase [Phycisphaerales bacterium]